MPRTINPFRRQIVKENLSQGKSACEALRQANYSEGHIRRSTRNRIVKDSLQELLNEADKRGILNQAWKVVDKDLRSSKYQHNIAPAFVLKDMAEKTSGVLGIVDVSVTDEVSRLTGCKRRIIVNK